MSEAIQPDPLEKIMMRTVLRKPAVLAATGWSNSTLYEKIARGIFPKPTKLDPDGRTVVWFADEIEEFQKRAVARSAMAA
jgi:predicted DNA-binding transcriptional regulator AlpA